MLRVNRGAPWSPGAISGASIEIMAALRTPVTGCPWDLEQSFETIAPYTIEEAYEVADAIERRDMGDLREELGDLLLQVVYHARLAEEAGLFAFPDVVEAITAQADPAPPARLRRCARPVAGRRSKRCGRTIKAEEKAERAARRGELADAPGATGLLADVPAAMPALTRAVKLQEKAATVGFDWNDIRTVLAKVREEADEIEAVLDDGGEPDRPRRRDRRSAVRGRQSRAPRQGRRRRRAARHQCQVRASLRLHRGELCAAQREIAARRASTRWTRSGTRRSAAGL